MRKKRNFVLIPIMLTAILVIAGFTGCGKQANANPTADKDKKGEEAVPIEITSVERGDISAYFTGTTALEPENEAKVVAKVGGVVEQIFVEEGHYVKENQVLAKLDDDRLSLDLAESEARLKQLENDFQRNQELYQKNIISMDGFERVKSEYEIQKARLGMARLMKDYTSIRAPISGVLAVRLIKVGNMVQTNEICFHISDFDPLLAVLFVPEKDLNKLQNNQKATIEVDSLPNQFFLGKILRMSPVIDSKTGTFKVSVAVTDPANKLKPGMFARIRIAHDAHTDTLLLLKDAVLSEGNESIVFLVNPKNKTVQRKVIEIGYVNTTHLEVIKGLNFGDQVVLTGIGGLKDGSPIEILANKTPKTSHHETTTASPSR